MRNSPKLIFTLALICAVAQASLIGNLINSTKVRAKGTFNMNNGLNMSYQSGVSFNLAGREINLIDVGVNFNAVPQVSSLKDNVTTSVRYTGDLSFTTGTNTSSTNVTISGETSLANSVVTSYDNTTQTTTAVVNQTISDSNSFVIRSGTTLITGKGGESLNSLSTVAQTGYDVKINQGSSLSANARGTVISNGTSLGAFTASSSTTSSTKQSASLHTWSWLPNVTYSGNTKFNNSNFLSFQNTAYNSSKVGSAGFIGYTEIRDGNGTLGVFSNQGLDYGYQTSSSVNNTVTNTSSVSGIGKVITILDSNNSGNGTSTGFFTAGSIYQVAKNTVGASRAQVARPHSKVIKSYHRRHSIFEDSEESVELFANNRIPYHNEKFPSSRSAPTSNSYYSALSAGWRAGALTTTELTSNTTAVTNTTAGAEYSVGGINTQSFKPWSTSGNESVTASFKTTILSDKISTIDNVTVSANTNPVFQKRMAQLQVPKVERKGLSLPARPRH